MKNERTYYAHQSIKLAEEAMKSIVVPSDVILDCNDDRLLGMRVRGMLIDKIRQSEEHIIHMKSFIENEEKRSSRM